MNVITINHKCKRYDTVETTVFLTMRSSRYPRLQLFCGFNYFLLDIPWRTYRKEKLKLRDHTLIPHKVSLWRLALYLTKVLTSNLHYSDLICAKFFLFIRTV